MGTASLKPKSWNNNSSNILSLDFRRNSNSFTNEFHALPAALLFPSFSQSVPISTTTRLSCADMHLMQVWYSSTRMFGFVAEGELNNHPNRLTHGIIKHMFSIMFYICTCVYTYVYIFMYIYIYIHAYMCISVYLYIDLNAENSITRCGWHTSPHHGSLNY